VSRRGRRQHASPLRPLRRQPALPGHPDPRPATRARRRADEGRLHGAGVGRLCGRHVRRARRRGGDPAGRPAPAGAGTHGRTSDRRRGDRRRPGVLGGDVGDSFEELERGDTPGRQLVLELAAPTYLAQVADVRVPYPRS
jgi:hypothetical protein